MTTLDLATGSGRTYRKVSTHQGGEYHGPCPACGGTDRFHIWPGQGEHGTYWCRQCDKAGDAIDYLREYEGKSYREACAILGKEVKEHDEHQRPQLRKPATAPENFQPRHCADPAETWREHATKLVDWAHTQLLGNQEQLDWLAARGLDLKSVDRYRLGWNPGEKGKDLYRVRESWGLDTVLKDDGKPKKLWIPIGLVIPCFAPGGELHRVRIRRPEGEPRYYLVPGSGTAPMVQGSGSRAFVIVESELDALMIHAQAGDMVGTISQGNSTARPDETSHAMLQQAVSILVALDSDPAGMTASVWWRKQYPHAERWPVPYGKDPGEAYKAGVNIREWVKAGLPPVLTMPPKRRPATAAPGQSHDDAGKTPRETPPVPGGTGAETVHTITARDGRTVHITDDETEYQRLVGQGKIVFDSYEIRLVTKMGGTPEESARFLDAKQIFPGIRIDRVELGSFPDPAIQKPCTKYQGKYAK